MSLVLRRYLSAGPLVIPRCPPPDYTTPCTYCEIPPLNKPIDYERDLNGTKSLPWKHVLILSHGITDFDTMPRKIELIPNQLSAEISGLKKSLFSPNHPIMVSNILLTNHQKFVDTFNLAANEQLVYIYPDQKVVRFDMAHTAEFIKKYLVPKDVKPAYNPFKTQKTADVEAADVDETLFTESAISKEVVLICGHTQRDQRCGVIAPLLQDEFEQVFEREGMDVELGLVSHIGGHAYAGNVIYFPTNGNAIWYGRVFPENVQGIVKETMIRGNIIKELYRGDL